MHAIDPIRWFDTRRPPLGEKLRKNRVHRFTLPAELGAPTEVVINITCVAGDARGWVKAWTGPEPRTSNVNFPIRDAICNTAHVKIGSDRTIRFKANQRVHLVVDVQAA